MERPQDWRWSSAAYYIKGDSIFELDEVLSE